MLRISPIEQYDQKKGKYEFMRQLATLGIPMCWPLEFGISDEGVYSVQSWIDGADAEEIIPKLSDADQYAYGSKAGQILSKIHSLPAPRMQEGWESRFNRNM